MKSKKQTPLDKIMTDGGITNAQLANDTGLSQGYISYLRSGKQDNPSASSLVLLAEALGCSVDLLLGR